MLQLLLLLSLQKDGRLRSELAAHELELQQFHTA
jgi:hypothetical protein